MADERRLHNVTSAYQSRADELDARRRRYLITMSARVVLFAVSILFFLHTPWLLYPSMVVSMFLPYVAVVLANGGRRKPPAHDAYVHDAPALGASPMVAIGPGRTIDAD